MNPVLGLVLFAAVASVTTGTPAGLCLNKKCPTYTVVATHSGYEERQYQPSVWVETAKKPGEGRLDIFSRLFNYMKGKNSAGQRIPMTFPVIGHLTSGATSAETNSMRFFLGADTGNFEPPRPTDPDVHVHHDPAMNYYVMSFNTNDWRNMEIWNNYAKNLKTMTGVSHNEFCGAGYGPRGPGSKYNEIWIHTSSSHTDHHYHHHAHNDDHDHHHGDHDHTHDDAHGHDHGGDDHNH